MAEREAKPEKRPDGPAHVGFFPFRGSRVMIEYFGHQGRRPNERPSGLGGRAELLMDSCLRL